MYTCTCISVCTHLQLLSLYVYPDIPKMRDVVVVYCVSISVCVFVDNVPTSPGLQNWECLGMVYNVSIRMYIYKYCPNIPKSPKMRVYRVVYYVSISVSISVGTVPTSPSLHKWECIEVVYCVPISVCIFFVLSPRPQVSKIECTGWYTVPRSLYVYPWLLSPRLQVSKI